MVVALETFVKQLADSGVITPGKLEHFIPPKAHPKDAEELARQLVQSRHLTKFQVQQIYQGRQKSLILGNYTLLDKIGAGGMGQVFKAHHRRMDRTVAIKMLPAAMTKDAEAIARFEREVRAAAKLNHPNIVAAHDADEANGVHFLVMEYVEGKDLSALVKKNGTFSVAKAIHYILQAAKGLEFAHRKGVIHRDIKPGNLLLDGDGTVKILDMGLARLDSPGGDAETQAELTGTGAVMGTVDYMAPEQALSTHHADARADIYSLGCSLYYLLNGKATYGGDTMMAKLLAHREQPIPALGAEVPEPVQAVFQKMVAKKVEDRYQKMSEVVAALEQCNSGQGSLSLQPSPAMGSGSDLMKFLRNATLNTAKKPQPVTKAAAGQAGNRGKTFVLGAVGAGLLGLAILAGVLFKLQTKGGTLVVEVDQPDAVVQVMNEEGKIEINDRSGKKPITLSVDPGKHKIKIEKDGFVAFAESFEIEVGGKKAITATLEPVKQDAVPAKPETQPVAQPENQLRDPDRSVAKWWLVKKREPGSHGFLSVVAAGKTKTVYSESDLPTGPFHIETLGTSKATDQDLTSIGQLSGLGELNLVDADVADTGIEKLRDMTTLKRISLNRTQVTATGIAALRAALPNCKIEWDDPTNPDKPAAVAAAKPVTTFKDAAFQAWMKDVAAMPAEQQVDAVAKKLQELNPGFDGKVSDGTGKKTPTIVNGVVTHFGFLTDNVTDISPVRALLGLKTLICNGTYGRKGILSSVSPLQGLQLTVLILSDTKVFDLSPLKGMPLTTLNCGGTQVSDALQLRGMELTSLNISGTKVSDLSPLKGMKLKLLSFSGSPVTDLSPLEGMPLTSLACYGSPVSDLAALKGMKLIVLSCYQTKISDLSPLKGMPLTELNCSYTNISDLSPLQGIPLTTLTCSDTKIVSLSALKGMPLNTLDCSNTRVSELTPLQGASLTKLNCANTKISDLAPLHGMKLTSLNCGVTQAADLSTLLGMPLMNLNCYATQVADLSPLASSPTLKSLDLRLTKATAAGIAALQKALPNCKIEKPITTLGDPDFQAWMQSVAPLSAEAQLEAVAKKMQELNPGFDGKFTGVDGTGAPRIKNGVVTELQFHSGNVTDLSPIRALDGLKVLFCSGSAALKSKLFDLSPLQGMKLTRFECSYTQIFDLSPLHDMPLTWLDLYGTQISDLSPLQGMKLTKLNCQVGQISDLSPLRGMPLKELSCNGSKVSDLSPLEGMPLKFLTFGLTKVSDLSPLKGMELSNLDLSYCPISDLSPLRDIKLTSHFSCNYTPVSDLSPLENCKSLKSVSANATKVTDLTPLRGMPLTSLLLQFTRVSDLSPLEDCKSLTFLDVKSTGVTAAGVAALQKALPNCQIEW